MRSRPAKNRLALGLLVTLSRGAPAVCAGLAACGGATNSPPEKVQSAPPVISAGAATPAAPANAEPDVSTGSALARESEFAKKAEGILGAFVNQEAAFSPDGKKVVFVSNREGVPQLYVADAAHPEAPATRLSQSSDRALGPTPTPDGKSVIFASDHGANEMFSYFRVDLDGKNLTQLTPEDKLRRDIAFVPSRAPTTLFYSGRTAANETLTGIYASPIAAPARGAAPPAPKWLYQDTQAGHLAAVSRDGKWGLFNRFRSASDNQIALVDLTKGTANTIYPLTGQTSRVFDVAFSADGSRVFVATDGGAEQMIVLALDPKSGKELGRYVEATAPKAVAEQLTVAPGGNVLAVSLNCGNRSELRLLDTRTLQPKVSVKMPLGHGYAGNFSDDGARVSAVWSTPDRPDDIYSIDTKTGAATPFFHSEARPSLDALSPIESAITEFESFDGTKIPVNVYRPPQGSAPAGGKQPVIVWFHGGPGGFSAIKWSPLARFFVSLGYAWVEPNVRGSVGFGRAFEAADNGPKRLDSFKDVEACARWVKSQPWADASRIVAFGESYGGYLVLTTLTRHPDLWRAGVDMFGIVNFKSFMDSTSGPVRANYVTEMGDPDKDSAFLESISPLQDTAKIAAPLFVYAGKSDPRVPKTESDQIVKALRQRKSPVEYMLKDNEGHGIVHRENQVEFYARVARFLESHLK